MAFTQDQLDALDAAIAGGTKRVKYADKEVEYPSLADMLRLRKIMQEELGLAKNVITEQYASYNKGVYPDESRR